MLEVIKESNIMGTSPSTPCDRFLDDGWVSTSINVPAEMELMIYVNGKELVTILCSPTKLNYLVLGFLYSEGIISGISDVASMRVCEEESLADVRLINSEYTMPTVPTLTSGCGSGSTFKSQPARVESDLVVAPMKILFLMKQLQEQMEIYRLCGGVHASAIADSKKVVVMAEDIGRHNTLDKVQGECLFRKLPTKDGMLLSTGRVSSEMLLKAAKMQAPVVVSRTSPTERAISLAHDLGITLVGYARGNRLSVYSHPERFDRSMIVRTDSM